jgi:predicted secreted protein
MGIVSGIVLYVLLWWTVIFCILPLWQVTSAAPTVGQVASAPVNARIGRKMIVTTIIAAVLWVPTVWAIHILQNDMRSEANTMNQEDHRS